MATATIKDVAREARVSVASVSRALNGGHGVTAETGQRIREVADRLRYVPHAAARTLITRRTNTIGALLPDLHGEFFSELIRGIDLAARARSLHLLVSSFHDDFDDAAAALRAMQGRVDGMLILSPRTDESFLQGNLSPSLPTVLLNSSPQNAACSTVNIDNYAGAHAMVKHLADMGHSQVAFIAGPARNFDAEQRERGYRAAMASFLPDSPLNIVAGDFTEASGHAAGKALLERPNRPDAIFAANDMMAVGCLSAIRDAQLEVPRDIALAGFDDVPIARYLTPKLSTVRVRIVELGRRALDQLAALLENPDGQPVTAQVLGCEVVARESCGENLTRPSLNNNQSTK
jgi:LacI family transcriptional regulator